MNLEALADFLAKRGLLLRSATFAAPLSFGAPMEDVAAFTCDPVPPAPAPETVGPRSVIEQPAKEPDALDTYLNRKDGRKPEGDGTP